jgi:hypothetical protein
MAMPSFGNPIIKKLSLCESFVRAVRISKFGSIKQEIFKTHCLALFVVVFDNVCHGQWSMVMNIMNFPPHTPFCPPFPRIYAALHTVYCSEEERKVAISKHFPLRSDTTIELIRSKIFCEF